MSNEHEIVLIEDNPIDAELTIRVLRKYHLAGRLVHLTDGQAALDFFFGAGGRRERNGPALPKVVLLDLKLPKVGGIEVLRQLRADERTRLMPIVVLTSSQEDRDMIETYNLGANSYIVKPVEHEDFSEAIRKMGIYWLHLNKPPPRKVASTDERAAHQGGR